VEKAVDRGDDRTNFVECEVGEKDKDDDGAYDLKVAELESDERFFEIGRRLGQSNPLFSRRIEDHSIVLLTLPCRAGAFLLEASPQLFLS
jgi:hypothetical protein